MLFRNVITAAALVASVLARAAHAATLSGKAVKVADGDTVTVVAGGERYRVQLAGIDAPERGQPGGAAPTAALRALALRKTVRAGFHKRDRYGRLVGVVLVPHPDCQRKCRPEMDAGLALVTLGHAWHFKHYAREQSPQDRERYAQAEEAARDAHVGLWAGRDAVPPWEWRAGVRAPGA